MKRQNGILFNEHSRLPSNLAIRKDVVNRISNPLTIITRNNTKNGQFTSLDEPVDSKFDQHDWLAFALPTSASKKFTVKKQISAAKEDVQASANNALGLQFPIT